MAELEFKYLNEIDISDSLTDSAHVIVEDGGNIRRAPMGQLITGGGVSSWNDLTDKPFYEEGSFEEILPETTLTMNNVSGMSMGSIIVDHTKITLGKIYKMVWDGVAYEAPAFEVSGQSGEGGEVITLVAIGNPAIGNFGEDNGIPFFAGNGANGEGVLTDNFMIITADTAATHTLSISAGSTTIHTLDEKFIPDTIARKSDLVNADSVKSWNDLGYSYSVMSWDGTTDGRECYTTPTPAGWTLNYYKISDTYLPADKFVGGTMIVSGVEDFNSFAESQGMGEVLPAKVQITEDMIVFADNGYAVIGMYAQIPLIISITAEYAASQSVDISEGTYALLADAEIMNQLFGSTPLGFTFKDNIFLTELKIIEKINLIPEDLMPEISWKNLSDKPFYEDDSTREVLIEPATYEVNGASSHGVVKKVTFYDLEHQLEDGEVYTIVIDGKEYVETAKRHGDGDVNYTIYIGDFNVVISEAEGWCFTDYYNDLGGCTKSLYVYNDTEEWGTFNVALYKGVSEYHTLDEKFIPDTIARVSDIPEQKTYTVNGVAADENGNIEIEVGSGSGLPEVSVENNGAFLRVVDGAWAIVNMTDVSIEGA